MDGENWMVEVVWWRLDGDNGLLWMDYGGGWMMVMDYGEFIVVDGFWFGEWIV